MHRKALWFGWLLACGPSVGCVLQPLDGGEEETVIAQDTLVLESEENPGSPNAQTPSGAEDNPGAGDLPGTPGLNETCGTDKPGPWPWLSGLHTKQPDRR